MTKGLSTRRFHSEEPATDFLSSSATQTPEEDERGMRELNVGESEGSNKHFQANFLLDRRSDVEVRLLPALSGGLRLRPHIRLASLLSFTSNRMGEMMHVRLRTDASMCASLYTRVYLFACWFAGSTRKDTSTLPPLFAPSTTPPLTFTPAPISKATICARPSFALRETAVCIFIVTHLYLLARYLSTHATH